MTARKVLEDMAASEHETAEARGYAADSLLEHDGYRYDRRLRALTTLGWWTLIAVIAACAMCCAYPKNVRSLAEEHGASVAIVVQCTESGPKPITIGSGVIVGEHEILTANHVMNPMMEMTAGPVTVKVPFSNCSFTARTEDGKEHPVHLSSVHSDIASISTTDVLPYTPVAWSTPNPGARACIVARHPWAVRRCGEIQYYRESDNLWAVTGVIVQPGNSGSGVYDERGRLIGITDVLFTCANGQWCEGGFLDLGGVK
jgi:S1-C subfamily serine protease